MALVADLEHTGPSQLWGDWAALYGRQPRATPFMSPGWARAWWPHFGGDATPYLWCLREGSRLVGLAPLVMRRKGPLRVLEAVGMDPGDYWDVLAEPGREGEVVDAFARSLSQRRDTWDAWVLRCLVPGSDLVSALDAHGLRALVRPPIAAPAIDLPSSFDEYLARLSSNRRSNLRKHLRRLDGGEVELREVTAVEALPEAVRRWQDFRRRQWEAAGKDINPEHLSPRFAGFMLDVLTELVPVGEALAWEFLLDGDVVGSYFNFVNDEAFHWYLGGFDPAVAKLGLGKIAIGHGIRTSIAAGRQRYDFGRGAEPYKYWYEALDRPLEARVVATGRPRSRLALAAAQVAISRRRD